MIALGRPVQHKGRMPGPEAFESGEAPPYSETIRRYPKGTETKDQALIDRLKQKPVKKFDPNQVRDRLGRWTRLGGGDLTEDEAGAIKNYTGYGGVLLNKGLWKGKIRAKDKKLLKTLDQVMSRSKITKPLVVYRAAPGALASEFSSKEGRTIEFKGYTSTSLSRNIASDFNQFSGTRALFRIKVPRGARGLDLSDASQKLTSGHSFGIPEKEILLPRRSRYKVTAVKGHIVDLEMVV